MTGERWQRVTELLAQASDVPPEDRRLFLEVVCAGDAELIAEVLELLEYADRAGDFLEPPSRLWNEPVAGRFHLKHELGHGGMGTVYSAFDDVLKRQVAVKLMRPELVASPELKERFLREARAAAKVNHPNVVTVHDTGVDDLVGGFIVMELLDGRSLREELAECGRLPVDEALPIARAVASAIEAAHKHGVMHRDLKPENVMLVHRDSGAAVKVVDFGIARLRGGTTRMTAEGAVMGTVGYMSPEQAAGFDVDERTDVYSLGCLLYEMLAGVAPHAGLTADDLPPGLGSVVLRALARERENRIASVREFVEALDAWTAAGPAGRVGTQNASLTDVVGRRKEITELVAACAAHRLVTLVGPPGSGKTRVAREASALAESGFDGGVVFVDLTTVDDTPGSIETAMCTAAGAPLGRNVGSIDDLARALDGRRALLVLSDVDGAIRSVARVAESLLSFIPALHVLVTGRTRLGLSTEAVHVLAPMPLADAVELFSNRARLAWSEFALAAEKTHVVEEICTRLGCIPLAIVLAASRVRVLSLEQIRDRLDDRFTLLERSVTGAPAKKLAMRAALDVSWELLSDEERHALRVFAGIEGSWSFADAESAFAKAGLDVRRAFPLLDRLVNCSLVQVEQGGGEFRYWLLETVREYVLESA